MSTEGEKLIEIWLDSASEREYQFGFRSALIFSGYKVLHDTSHTSLELGKDIIAINPDGDVFAYQLKGNPDGRITISQWHSLLPQINALVYHPLSHPNLRAGTPYQPYLVTNGEIHEDVLAAIAAYNAEIIASGRNVRPLQTIARGELLSMFVAQSAKIWPVDIEAQREILNLLASSGHDCLPQKNFSTLVERILGFNDDAAKFKVERIASAHLVTAIIAANWSRNNNLYEVAKIYTLLYAKMAAYLSRSNAKGKAGRSFVTDVEFNIWSTALDFIKWVKDNFDQRPLTRNILQEFSYYHLRKKMLIGFFATVLLRNSPDLSSDIKDFLWRFVCRGDASRFLAGEFIIPFCLAHYWASSNFQGTLRPDAELIGILNTILTANSADDVRGHLPGPYYNAVDVIEWSHQEFLGRTNVDLEYDSHHERSWFSEAIFYLMVRRNYKKSCQLHWYRLTKFLHMETKLDNDWEFALNSSVNARHRDKQIKVPQSWSDVVETASEERMPNIPPLMLENPLIVLLFCLFVPYRMNFDVVMWLDRQFIKESWY